MTVLLLVMGEKACYARMDSMKNPFMFSHVIWKRCGEYMHMSELLVVSEIVAKINITDCGFQPRN